jgi:hypothetical protein
MDFSLEQTVVVINGHTVTGFSEDADGISFPNIDLATVTRGADGKMVAVSTGDKGGPLVLKLLPNSPSVKFFMNAVTAQMNGGAVKWAGNIRDASNQISFSLSNGTLTNAPLGQTIGKGSAKNAEFTIEFEAITPEYQASTF